MIKAGQKYKHFKGNEYLVLHLAKHSETEEDMVVYQALYGDSEIWVRPLIMFEEKVEMNGEMVNRFEEIKFNINGITMCMMEFFKDDVHQINHALKVYGFARTIGELENIPENKQLALEVAAILHDIGIPESIKKYGSDLGKYQEIEGSIIAREILKDYNLSEEIKERVRYLIGNHHSYNNIDDIDFQILVEADFFVNIYENNIGKDQILSIKDKYFKTNTGKVLINSMYL